MKKLLLVNLLALLVASVGFAQDLDITQVYFSNSGSTSGQIQNDSIPLNSNKFIIAVYQNNLLGNQGLVASDSLSFGYSVGGSKVGETGRLAGRSVPSGGQVPFIVDDNYPTGSTERFNVEMCVWSLYNPYNAQTADNNITELCRSTFNFADPVVVNPSSIADVQSVEDVTAFYSRDAIQLMMAGAKVGSTLDYQVIDLTGQVVLENQVRINSGGDVYESISFNTYPQGVYLMNVKSSDFAKTIKFVKN